MRIPRLEIYLDEKSELCIGKVERDGAEPRLIFDIGLNELHSHGEDEATKRVGETILRILKIWHKDIFANLQNPANGTPVGPSEFDVAMELIGLSVSSKTSAHIQSIGLLLEKAAVNIEPARKFLNESWSSVRLSLEGYS